MLPRVTLVVASFLWSYTNIVKWSYTSTATTVGGILGIQVAVFGVSNRHSEWLIEKYWRQLKDIKGRVVMCVIFVWSLWYCLTGFYCVITGDGYSRGGYYELDFLTQFPS